MPVVCNRRNTARCCWNELAGNAFGDAGEIAARSRGFACSDGWVEKTKFRRDVRRDGPRNTNCNPDEALKRVIFAKIIDIFEVSGNRRRCR